mmetsp:Transcript_43/g.88  ORF Transcript_43/g.88 Transcript_43/m.88 type:complete len:214 (-) Transcript_43:181-822(-)
MPKREREKVKQAERQKRIDAKRLKRCAAKLARINDALGIKAAPKSEPEVSEAAEESSGRKLKKMKKAKAKTMVLAKNVRIQDICIGNGDEVKAGARFRCSYTGRLRSPKGPIFDESQSFTGKLTAGKNGVIEGWIIGLPGMRVGGTRRLTVPPDAGYGIEAYGHIPACSTLVFDVTIIPGVGLKPELPAPDTDTGIETGNPPTPLKVGEAIEK